MTTAALTPKQQQALDQLRKGRSVSQVAKAMKISDSGVYGHIRRLKQAGVEVPGHGSANAPASPPPVKPAEPEFNGEAVEVDVPTVIRAQIQTAQATIQTLENEAKEMAERAEKLRLRKEQLIAEIERHDAALSAYQVK